MSLCLCEYFTGPNLCFPWNFEGPNLFSGVFCGCKGFSRGCLVCVRGGRGGGGVDLDTLVNENNLEKQSKNLFHIISIIP